MSEASERSQHLFLVRIWYEPSQATSNSWRGSVEHVPSRQQMYFTSLRDLDDFIRLRIGVVAPVDQKD